MALAGSGIAADTNGNIYIPSGNGDFDTKNVPATELGDTILKLGTTNANLTLLDYFTPSDQQTLDNTDSDLGSGGVANRPRTLNYTDLGDGRFHLYSCMDSSVPRHGVHLFRMTSDLVVKRGDRGSAKRVKVSNSRGMF